MSAIELTTSITSDPIIMAVAKEDGVPEILRLNALPKAGGKKLAQSLGALGVTGDRDQVVRTVIEGLPTVILVGLGLPAAELTPEALRQGAGRATSTLKNECAQIVFPTVSAVELQAVCEGALMGAYRYNRYRENPGVEGLKVLVAKRDKSAPAALEEATITATAVNGARDLVNASPADLYPETFADYIKTAISGTRIKMTTWDEKKLAAQNCGGILGVGQGSARPPRMVMLDYRPPRAKGHLSFVGKGITFDTGGLSLKPAKSMETMKSDMAGAAAVVHTVIAAAQLKLLTRVTGWVALAENMPDGGAIRPSDILTMCDGTTVEVLNTDAEGRLVLADALVKAREQSPDLLVDIATLTGAQIVALGSRICGVMGTDKAAQAVVASAGVAGEKAWHMPLPRELKDGLKSKYADLANIGRPEAGMLTAGVFLQHFAGEANWAHIDIAGPSFNERAAYGYTPAGATGFGVRTLLELAKNPPSSK